MNGQGSFGRASLAAVTRRVLQRVRSWWWHGDADDRYLSAAADLADVERRMRVLERTSRGPVFQTFNH